MLNNLPPESMNTFVDLCLNALCMLYLFVSPLKTRVISDPRFIDLSRVMLQLLRKEK